MFESTHNRIASKGIKNKLDPKIQWLCWALIDELVEQKKVTEIDYLQVFTFEKKVKKNKLILTHSQNKPWYKDSMTLSVADKVSSFPFSKIYVIDDGTYQTMMLPEEY